MKKIILIKLLFVFSMYLSGCAGREISDYSWGSVRVCVSIGHINNRSDYYEGLEYKIFLESENQDNVWNVGDIDNDGDDDVISSGLRSIEWVTGSLSRVGECHEIQRTTRHHFSDGALVNDLFQTESTIVRVVFSSSRVSTDTNNGFVIKNEDSEVEKFEIVYRVNNPHDYFFQNRVRHRRDIPEDVREDMGSFDFFSQFSEVFSEENSTETKDLFKAFSYTAESLVYTDHFVGSERYNEFKYQITNDLNNGYYDKVQDIIFIPRSYLGEKYDIARLTAQRIWNQEIDDFECEEQPSNACMGDDFTTLQSNNHKCSMYEGFTRFFASKSLDYDLRRRPGLGIRDRQIDFDFRWNRGVYQEKSFADFNAENINNVDGQSFYFSSDVYENRVDSEIDQLLSQSALYRNHCDGNSNLNGLAIDWSRFFWEFNTAQPGCEDDLSNCGFDLSELYEHLNISLDSHWARDGRTLEGFVVVGNLNINDNNNFRTKLFRLFNKHITCVSDDQINNHFELVECQDREIVNNEDPVEHEEDNPDENEEERAQGQNDNDDMIIKEIPEFLIVVPR